MRHGIKQLLGRLLAHRRKNAVRTGHVNFLDSIDLSLLDDIDIDAFQREMEIDELIGDLMNYIKNVDYCHEVLRTPNRDH